MIILAAESKTMSANQREIPGKEFLNNLPEFESEADRITDFLRSQDAGSLAELIGISVPLAQKAVRLYYDFPDKSTGYPAVDGYTGEVFRALSYSTLDDDASSFLRERLLIVSSLYGILGCYSIIKPYRLDFTTDAAEGGMPMWKFWKPKATVALVRFLRQRDDLEVVNLLPAEAAKCIDWKIVKAFARVEKPDFKIVTSGGELKTPHSGKLKEFRGVMLRLIAENRIGSIDDLLSVSGLSFTADPESYRPGLPVFIGI